MKTLSIKKSPPRHEIVSSEQFRCFPYLETIKAQSSKRAAQSLNTIRVLPVYLFLWKKSKKIRSEKMVNQKIA